MGRCGQSVPFKEANVNFPKMLLLGQLNAKFPSSHPARALLSVATKSFSRTSAAVAAQQHAHHSLLHARQKAKSEAAAAKAAAEAAMKTPASLLTGVVAPPEHWAPLADRAALLEMHWLPLDGAVQGQSERCAAAIHLAHLLSWKIRPSPIQRSRGGITWRVHGSITCCSECPLM